VTTHAIAVTAHRAGLHIIGANGKRPDGQWKEYQADVQPPLEMVARHESVGILTGTAANVEAIDFDASGWFFPAYWGRVESERPDISSRLVVERSPSGGYHLLYRCDCGVGGSAKLASVHVSGLADGQDHMIRRHGCDVRICVQGSEWWYVDRPEKRYVIKDGALVGMVPIETRGQGGFIVVAPSPGYQCIQFDIGSLPVLSEDDRRYLLDVAVAMGDPRPPPQSAPQPLPQQRHQAPAVQGINGHTRVGDWYNEHGDHADLLRRHGWHLAREAGGNEEWIRPGKDSSDGISATWSRHHRRFCNFSTSAGLPCVSEAGDGNHLTLFGLLAELEHGGDYRLAAKAVAAMVPCERRSVPSGSTVGQADHWGGFVCCDDDDPTVTDAPEQKQPPGHFISAEDLIGEGKGYREPLIDGLLRRGETMNVIAAPKTGKSWLVMQLAFSLAHGVSWMGRECSKGTVLLIDNELHRETLGERLRAVSRAMRVDARNIHAWCLRGALRPLTELATAIIERAKVVGADVIVFDALYRLIPAGVSENDNSGMMGMYNILDQIAEETGAACICVHHSSKGNQSEKSTTDGGAGAGAISRAADSHLFLRQHEDEGQVSIDAVARSWPPPDPWVIAFDGIWHLVPGADPSRLKKASRNGSGKAATVAVAEIVARLPQSPMPYKVFVADCSVACDCTKQAVESAIGKAVAQGDACLPVGVNNAKMIVCAGGAYDASGSKSDCVREYLRKHPDALNKDICMACECDVSLVRKVRNE